MLPPESKPVKALVVSSRFPWPSYTGDRIRTAMWVEALCRRGCEVTLVTPAGDGPPPPCRAIAAPRSAPALAAGAVRVLRDGLPATALLAAGHDWRGALAAAHEGIGEFEVAVIVLARTEPWVGAFVTARRTVVDGIDSLAANLDERGRAAIPPASWLWRLEARRMARLERSLPVRHDTVVVVAETEVAGFAGRAVVAGLGVELRPIGETARGFDVGFWGRLPYFANRDAARVLLDEVWPLVRRQMPQATLLVGGVGAPAFVRRRHGRDGVTVVSPMDDRAALLRRVRVALFPIRFGSGQPTKVLEAAEAGCAIVATPAGVRGVGELAFNALVGRDPAELAAHAVGMLRDPDRTVARGRAARAIAERDYSLDAALARLAAIALDA